jgi:hypothetical protein
MFTKPDNFQGEPPAHHAGGDALRDLAATEVERNLHIEVLPGTEVFEFDGADIVKSGKDGMVLVPQPSRDPNDPLVRHSNTSWFGC